MCKTQIGQKNYSLHIIYNKFNKLKINMSFLLDKSYLMCYNKRKHCQAKNDLALKGDQKNDMFKRRVGIHKTYLALVCGKVDKEGKINKPLNKDEKDKTVRIDYKEGKTYGIFTNST